MLIIFKKYPKLFCAFSEKADGSMKLTNNPVLAEKISQNRKDYFLKNDINPEKVVSAEIIHGNKVAIVGEKNSRKIISDSDGLISQSANIYLSITSADCLPIFLFEPENEIVGLIHAGWRSLEKSILANAVEKIKSLDGLPKNILVGIGPAICQKHYEVGTKVAEKFKLLGNSVSKSVQGRLYLDIKKIAQLQLLELGVVKESIEINPECTFELPEKYFSARRDRKKKVEAMIATIGMKK